MIMNDEFGIILKEAVVVRSCVPVFVWNDCIAGLRAVNRTRDFFKYRQVYNLDSFSRIIAFYGLKTNMVQWWYEGKDKFVSLLFLTEHHAMKKYCGSGGIILPRH
jgi:hypothetical protein